MAKLVRSGDGHRSFVLTKNSDRVLVEMRSERVTLRGLRWADLEDYAASMDEEVLHWQGFSPAFARHTLDQFADAVLASWRHWPLQLAVCENDSNAFIGVYLFGPRLRAARPRANLGWWLGPNGRGRGLGSESLLLALQYGHTHLRLREVVMGTSVANVRTRAQIARSGAEFTGQRPHQLYDGTEVDSVWFRHRVTDGERTAG